MDASVASLLDSRFLERLRRKDVSLFAKNPQEEDLVRGSLGWITAPAASAAGLGPLRSFAEEFKAEGWKSLAVLGMGGSILSGRVFRDCFAKAEGFPRLEILDSIHPDAVRDFEAALDLRETFFIVASKSGSTVESNCLMDYFYAHVDRLFPGKAGRRFAAITDPGTSLEKKARRLGFRRVFSTPPDIGGRFSVWTAFGLAPAALSGVDAEAFLRGALARENELWTTGADNPALKLGALLAQGELSGKDKLVLELSPRWRSLGPWIVQMVAEALGKNGRGLLPVLRDSGAEKPARAADELPIDIEAVRGDAAGQFLLWEIAVCAAAFLMGVNPFGEPDVESAKAAARDILEAAGRKKPGKAAERGPKPDFYASGIPAFCDAELKKILFPERPTGYRALSETFDGHLGRGRAGDYCAVLAYASPDEKNSAALSALAGLIAQKTGLETILDFGPAYLHSGGQFYKGGRNCGLFVEIIVPPRAPLPLPRRRYGFETLCRAQAEGDFAALLLAGRRALRLDLGNPGANHMAALLNALDPQKTWKEKTTQCRN
ncbi:MAG TPA: hypothetical protein VNK24_12105 [Elusimicrobiota bacterium]|nr:hypothetical protein [Elusimicrobiota bacterium]